MRLSSTSILPNAWHTQNAQQILEIVMTDISSILCLKKKNWVLMLLVKFCPVAKCNVDLDWYGQHSKKESFSTSFRRRSRLYDPEIIPPGIYLREVKTLSIQNLCTNVLKRFFLSQNSGKSKMSNKREEFTNLSI